MHVFVEVVLFAVNGLFGVREIKTVIGAVRFW